MTRPSRRSGARRGRRHALGGVSWILADAGGGPGGDPARRRRRRSWNYRRRRQRREPPRWTPQAPPGHIPDRPLGLLRLPEDLGDLLDLAEQLVTDGGVDRTLAACGAGEL